MNLKYALNELKPDIKKYGEYRALVIETENDPSGEERVIEHPIIDIDIEEEAEEINFLTSVPGKSKINGLTLRELWNKLVVLMPDSGKNGLFVSSSEERIGDHNVRIDTPLIGIGYDHDGKSVAFLQQPKTEIT